MPFIIAIMGGIMDHMNSLWLPREECFYNNDGKWYYAGVYKAFRLEDLSTKEWEALSAEVRFYSSPNMWRQLNLLCRPL
jgi:hypothetical protein